MGEADGGIRVVRIQVPAAEAARPLPFAERLHNLRAQIVRENNRRGTLDATGYGGLREEYSSLTSQITPDNKGEVKPAVRDFPLEERPLLMTSDVAAVLADRYALSPTLLGNDACDALGDIASGRRPQTGDFSQEPIPQREVVEILSDTFGEETARDVFLGAIQDLIKRRHRQGGEGDFPVQHALNQIRAFPDVFRGEPVAQALASILSFAYESKDTNLVAMGTGAFDHFVQDAQNRALVTGIVSSLEAPDAPELIDSRAKVIETVKGSIAVAEQNERASYPDLSDELRSGLQKLVPRLKGFPGYYPYDGARETYAESVVGHIQTPEDIAYVREFLTRIPEEERPLLMTADVAASLEGRYERLRSIFGHDAIAILRGILSGVVPEKPEFQGQQLPIADIVAVLRNTFGDATAGEVLGHAIGLHMRRVGDGEQEGEPLNTLRIELSRLTQGNTPDGDDPQVPSESVFRALIDGLGKI